MGRGAEESKEYKYTEGTHQYRKGKWYKSISKNWKWSR